MEILEKIWEGNTVYQEPVCFSADGNGGAVGGKLLCPPKEIIKVCSYDGQICYREGEDYLVEPWGIRRTGRSRIPFLPREIYCKQLVGHPEKAWLRLPGSQHYIEVMPDVYRYQVLVTYRNAESWNGFTPESQLSRLRHTAERLRSGKELNLVFYGDSITAGWEASGADEWAIDRVDLSEYHVSIKRPPYMPAWAQLVTDELKRCYPGCTIHKTNRAAGGSTTGWGLKNATQLVNPCAPDLVILSFGMNCMQDPPEKFQAEIEGIIASVREEYPLCEFLLVSPMIPNPEMAGFQNNQMVHHQERLAALCESHDGVGLAPVHSMFLQMSAYGKQYLELTGNCVNHPNDFSIRVYAQCVLTALGL